jgi:hypothetical protein
VAEEAVDVETGCEERAQALAPGGEGLLAVGGLAEAQVAEGGGTLERAHARDAALVDPFLDLGRLPRVVAEVEGHVQIRIERVEQEAKEAVVANLGHLDPHGSEAVAEPAHCLGERVHALDATEGGDPAAHGDGEAEARWRLPGPALELPLGREVVEGRVELDGRQPLGVAAEELLGPGVGGVEPSAPGRVGEAGRARVEAAYEPSSTS